MIPSQSTCVALPFALLAMLLNACVVPPPPKTPGHKTHIGPLLDRHCVRCHNDRVQESRLDLRTRELILQGGDSGPAVVPGKPLESLLFEQVVEKRMPPEGRRLTGREIDLLRRWIEGGALP